MTEQEIIEYLKKNKKEGRILAFMPEEVRKWCEEHICEEHIKELLVWQSHRWYDAEDICTDDVVALPDDYKVKEEPKGKWVEFGIKKNGRFTAFDVDDNDHQISFSFGWHQWSEFIDCSYEHDLGYTAFGGWKYAEWENLWFTQPQTITKDGVHCCGYHNDDKPAIPVRIRFWKGE